MSALNRDKVQKPDIGRPHIHILGAGASYAAFQNGDKHGRKLPLMLNIVDVLGLHPILEKAGVKYTGENFEVLYSNLIAAGVYAQCVSELESAIFDYFAALELPDEPTLYDHLVWSLREKDIIATFNWDPFLVQAASRCYPRGGGPRLLFLHGNTAVGYCVRHARPSVGNLGNKCGQCGEPLERSRLLFPIAKKNYDTDPLIKIFWSEIRKQLPYAYLLTIFGYGAPASDVEAVDLLRQAWGDAETRQFEEVEIIDVRPEEELHNTWSPFILSHHYRVERSFYDSIVSLHPRRSCDAMWAQFMEAKFIDNNPIPAAANWNELEQFMVPLLDDEAESGV